MKLFQFIALTALCITTSSLFALYPQFNIGGKINKCVLSPDGKFLVNTNYDDPALKLWNAQTGQLHSRLDARYDGRLFFSSDSTKLFQTQDNILGKDSLLQYSITQEGLSPINPIILHKESKFSKSNWMSSYAYVTNEQGAEFKRLETKSSLKQTLSCFLTTLLPDTTETHLELISEICSLYDGSCIISPDAKSMAVYCEKYPSNPRYIHIIDLETRSTTHNYRIPYRDCVESINFSPDKTKLVLAARITIQAIGYANYWFEIIDLNTNQLFRFKQEKRIEYAAFIDNATVLTVLEDGSVSYHEITSENLEQHRVNNESDFRVLTDDPFDW